MSRKNRDVFSEIIVGIFMVAVLALLAYFTIVISGVDLLMGRAKTTGTFVFRDVGGLKERDSVMYRGMKVGAVERIELGASNITVRVKVDSDVVMRSTAPTFMPRYITLSRSFSPPTSWNTNVADFFARPSRRSTPDITIVKYARSASTATMKMPTITSAKTSLFFLLIVSSPASQA